MTREFPVAESNAAFIYPAHDASVGVLAFYPSVSSAFECRQAYVFPGVSDQQALMASYLFQLRDGDVEQQVHHDLRDDLEALKTAEFLAANFDVEVSCEARLVVRIRKAHVPRGY
jgi:hypothetical protein